VELTKYSHSCVRFDDGDRSLAVDPGVFSEAAAALDGVDGVLITHEHPDHLDAGQLVAAAKRDPRLRIWAPPAVAGGLAELGEQVVAVEPGHAFDAVGFPVRVFGGQHALIHPTIPVVANNGYLVGDAVFHPGDALVVPPATVELLLAPIHAPWSKVAEVIDFVVAVRAARAVGIHEAGLSEIGRGLVEGHVARIGAEHGCEYRGVAPGETLTV
jgi:L-ascorbate metabolism protein UlaG (beta-lactamase superfamily)